MAGEVGLTLSRRAVVGGFGAALALPAIAEPSNRYRAAFAALESKSGGRLGVAILDTGTGRITGHRTDERFGMCSTFKLPLAAVILAEIDAGRLRDERVLGYAESDLVPNSPVTRANVDKGGMTIVDLAKAAQQASDNTAANLLIRLLGGPRRMTHKLRTMGDSVSRLDRYEPAMNLVLPGEIHDTTTPRGMVKGMNAYLLGGKLKPATRDLLTSWMIETKTGARRLRAGLPPEWRAGDKTGSSWNERVMVDKVNDVGIFWPPGRAPVIVAAYLDAAAPSGSIRPEDESVLGEVGRVSAYQVGRP
jgi:beta-lactamase class A